jgi:hypothetical protein
LNISVPYVAGQFVFFAHSKLADFMLYSRKGTDGEIELKYNEGQKNAAVAEAKNGDGKIVSTCTAQLQL